MGSLSKIITADYLQRTRSYSFLITLLVTVFMAYSFVPPSTASYTTLSASGYKGVYNSAWVGYVSGIMTTVMLSFYGFLLVNSGIRKDIDTEVGLIIATTPITNFKYLLIKQLSNYLVLLTIVAITFIVSILVFLMRGTGYPFILGNFVQPYLFFAVPALFVVSALAVVAEVFLYKHNLLQFISYFFLCGLCMGLINTHSDPNSSGVFDPFGLSLITHNITQHINTNFHEHVESVSFGFIFNGNTIAYKSFTWEGLQWSPLFIFSRLIWMGLGLSLIYISSLFFHRFDFKQAVKVKKRNKSKNQAPIVSIVPVSAGFSRMELPNLHFSYGIFLFIKTEFILLVRQGNKWLWLINAGIWVAMIFVPFAIAYNYLLPILLFLQVTRWSELATKDKTNRVHYFAYAAYKPLQRMLTAQILAGLLLAITLALPMIIRCALIANSTAIISILNGLLMIVLLAVALGVLTGGKKLFEVVFFMLTYAVINKVPITDYLGNLPHENMTTFSLMIFAINVSLATLSFVTRKYQINHN